MYIYQRCDWPKFIWDSKELVSSVSEVRMIQGEMVGRLASLGFDMKDDATIEALSLEIVKSNAIEGESLNREDVRSSIAKRLGKEWNQTKTDRHIDGIVDVMMDALKNSTDQLTNERLYSWHAAIFPTGYSGMNKITTGSYRKKDEGRMVVESASYSNPVVHFEAPKDNEVLGEMKNFIRWFNTDTRTEPVVKSGIAHLWFLTIHPFEDGNGRIARAISDMQLSRADKSEFRFYSMSDQIEKNRKAYYQILENTQKGDLDITTWLKWYVMQVHAALDQSRDLLKGIIKKSEFWIENNDKNFNDRQRKMVNKLFDGFEGKLSTSKWAKICKCSEDSALRDINDLVSKEILGKGSSGGRSSYYYLNKLGDQYQEQNIDRYRGISM